MPHSLRFVLLSLFLVGSISSFSLPVLAQQRNCSEILRTAQQDYDLGRFDDVITNLQPCLDDTGLSEEERRRGYRLMGLSFLGKDAENDARDAVKLLLELVPNYQPNPVEDPPTFVQMVEEIRQEMDSPSPPSNPSNTAQAGSGGGIKKWLLIGGGVAAAAVVAILLLSNDGDDGPREINEVEPNNFQQTAQNISGSSPLQVFGTAESSDVGDIFITFEDGSVDDMEDLFRINITENGIQIDLSGFTVDCDVYLIDSNLTILGRSDLNGLANETISLPSLQTGEYIIAVTIFDPDGQDNGSSDYTLDVSFGAPEANSFQLRTVAEENVTEQALSYQLIGAAGHPTLKLDDVMNQAAEGSWAGFEESGSQLSTFDGSDTFAFETGRGFWVKTTNPLPPLQAQEPAPINPDGTVHIPVHRGWNIIVNPYESDLDWQWVQRLNGTSQKLWAWDGHYHTSDLFAAGTTQEAYYYYHEGEDEILRIPSLSEALPSPSVSFPDDILRISAVRDGHIASSIALGFSPFASTGRDPLDQVAPPGYFETATLRLIHVPAVSQIQPLVLTEEYRPRSLEGHTYDMALASPVGEPITLEVEGLEAFSEYDVVLIDEEHQDVHDLTRSSFVTLVPQSQETTYRLVIGTRAFVQAARAELAGDHLLVSNYPNPFNPSTRISYTIPTAADGEPVRLEVFNVLGQRVRLLVEKTHAAGQYEVEWDGRDDAGAQVSSGVYLYRIQAGSTHTSGRMLMAK